MKKGHLAVIILLLLLSACSSSRPALQATWYLVPEKETKGYSDFRAEEFTGNYSIKALCEKLRKEGLAIQNNAIDNLNELLKKSDLYGILKSKSGHVTSERLDELEEAYKKYRTEDSLKKLNRVALEEVFPQETPKSQTKKETKTEIYVAILNQHSRTIQVKEITLNPGSIADEPKKGWTWNGKVDGRPLGPLGPGEMLFLKVTDLELNGKNWKHDDCRVPVRVTVVDNSDDKPFEAEMIGTMPSSVPEDWEMNCKPPLIER